MAVVERGHQADVFAQQHAVAEHVAAHIADSDDGEVLTLGVDAHLAEVALHRLPRTFGGDRHGLVVVPHRTAGGERISEPEPASLRDTVGDVGEGGRSLIRGDHQVGVIGISAHHPRRRHHLTRIAIDFTGGAIDIVGDIEKPGHEQGVALDTVGADVPGRLLDDESALRADRHDDRVLHRLRLDQSEHFSAEVFAAIRPTQATAGHLAEPQMHTLDAR